MTILNYLQLVHDHVKLFVPPLVFHIGALAAPEYVVRARVVLTQRGSASGSEVFVHVFLYSIVLLVVSRHALLTNRFWIHTDGSPCPSPES